MLPIAAIPSIISVAGSVTDTLHFLQYPDDKKRRDSANALLTRAAQGDTVAEAQLRLLSGVGSIADIATMRAAGLDPGCSEPQQCGWATTWAKTYGKRLLAELAARRAAGYAGAVAIRESTIPDMVTGSIQRAASNPLVWVAVAVGVYLVTRKGRR